MDAKRRLVEEARSEMGEFLFAPNLYHGTRHPLAFMVASYPFILGGMEIDPEIYRGSSLGINVDKMASVLVAVA